MEAATVPGKAPRVGLWGASPALTRLASDAQLVTLVRAGRKAAFEAVYDRHHRPILAFCGHLLGDRDEAEDALQHTFLSAYNGIVAGSQPIQLRPWLFAIARNRCYSMLRARREVAVGDVSDAVSEGPAAVVQRREEIRDLVVDLGRLPHDQCAALVMAEIGALSHEEIAVALEVPRDKVKALVFQARESLVATRTARETDCDEIRRQLRTTRGPALRRGPLRRHLHDCPGCREYRRQLRHQRGRLAVVLPFAPTLALKDAVLSATVGGRSAIAGASGSAGAGTVVKLGLLKPVVGAVVAVVGAASAVVVVHTVVHHGHASAVHLDARRLAPVMRRGHHPGAVRGHASAPASTGATLPSAATREFVSSSRHRGRATGAARREVRYWAHRSHLDGLAHRRAMERRRRAASTHPRSAATSPSRNTTMTGTLAAQGPASAGVPLPPAAAVPNTVSPDTTPPIRHPEDPGAVQAATEPRRGGPQRHDATVASAPVAAPVRATRASTTPGAAKPAAPTPSRLTASASPVAAVPAPTPLAPT